MSGAAISIGAARSGRGSSPKAHRRLRVVTAARRRSPTSPASARCAARTTRRMPLRPSRSLMRSAWLEPRRSAPALATFPGLPHRMEEVGRARARALRQRLQGDQRRLDREGARLLRRASSGSSAASRRRAASRRLRPYFPKVAKAYLIGEASDDFAATLDGAVPLCALRHARPGASAQAAADAGALGRAGAGRAALAGLRVLRPVSEFRGARRPLPRPRPGAARRSTDEREGYRAMMSRAERSLVGDWWWTVDRFAARGAWRP